MLKFNKKVKKNMIEVIEWLVGLVMGLLALWLIVWLLSCGALLAGAFGVISLGYGLIRR